MPRSFFSCLVGRRKKEIEQRSPVPYAYSVLLVTGIGIGNLEP